MSDLGLDHRDLSKLLEAIESKMYYLESKRSYNNTNDPDEKYRLGEIEYLRNLKKKIKLYIKNNND